MEDVRKMLDNAGKVLRFSARLESVLPADQHRQFILTYYLEDDSIAIFEQPKANSGIRYLVHNVGSLVFFSEPLDPC